jgi:hypothetical protein
MKNTFIEMAHIYSEKLRKHLDSNTTPKEFSHLSGFEFNENETLAILIDDKYNPCTLSNKYQFSIFCQNKIRDILGDKLEVSIYFESEFTPYQEKMLQESVNAQGYDSAKNIFESGKPSCFLLSRAWLLFRLRKAQNVITIIDEKYKVMEMDIYSTLPEKDKKRCKWLFIK